MPRYSQSDLIWYALQLNSVLTWLEKEHNDKVASAQMKHYPKTARGQKPFLD